MSTSNKATPRAIADLSAGTILASVEIAAPPERVFRAISSEEIVTWWGSDDLYRTTAFTADLRPGGRWRTEGKGADGVPFSVEGEYLEVDAPRKLVHTWEAGWDPGHATTVTYHLEATAEGTRLTIRHDGFSGRAESCQTHATGWERVLGWLTGHLHASAPPARFFALRLLPPRPSFMQDMNADERAMMQAHVGYWMGLLKAGTAVLFGPVADPKGAWGLGVIRAADEAAVKTIEAEDPAIAAGRGLRYEILPMLNAVF